MSAELVRHARQGERLVATIRCWDDAEGTAVEAEVSPANGGAPVRRGPYRFPNAHEAFRFVQEALQSLEYLGCTVG